MVPTSKVEQHVIFVYTAVVAVVVFGFAAFALMIQEAKEKTHRRSVILTGILMGAVGAGIVTGGFIAVTKFGPDHESDPDPINIVVESPEHSSNRTVWIDVADIASCDGGLGLYDDRDSSAPISCMPWDEDWTITFSPKRTVIETPAFVLAGSR